MSCAAVTCTQHRTVSACRPMSKVGDRAAPRDSHGCIGREGALEAAPEAVRQAVGGGCQSGWGRLLSVTNAVEAGTGRQGESGWASAGRPGGGGGVPLPPLQCMAGERAEGRRAQCSAGGTPTGDRALRRTPVRGPDRRRCGRGVLGLVPGAPAVGSPAAPSTTGPVGTALQAAPGGGVARSRPRKDARRTRGRSGGGGGEACARTQAKRGGGLPERLSARAAWEPDMPQASGRGTGSR